MSECRVYVDTGTTNTRVWLGRGEHILARAHASVGVRDTARDGTPLRLHHALRDLIAEVSQKTQSTTHVSCEPSCVIAAGMITSPLGLTEVPHVHAPAGFKELAAGVERHSFPDVTDLPVLLVPGVRSGPRDANAETIRTVDVMRGEETLCVGLIALGLLGSNGTLLNLGSHWKAIQLDAEKRIASSITSLAGELVHAAQTQTILASAVPHERPQVLDESWLEAGMREQRRSGLPRALFCVRLLEQGSNSTPDERLAYLVGAFVAADLDALSKRRMLTTDALVLISGGGAVAAGWRHALAQSSVEAVTLADDQVERALLTGLRYLAASSTMR